MPTSLMQVPGLEGLKLDATNYTTAFRAAVTNPEQAAQLAAVAADRGLDTAGNLGKLDVFPTTSGKESAARWLMARFGTLPSDAVLMCGALSLPGVHSQCSFQCSFPVYVTSVHCRYTCTCSSRPLCCRVPSQ